MQLLHINKDIWAEIMSYFTVSLADDEPDKIKAKRRLFLSLALTTFELTELALDQLWRSMQTLEPIVQVLNYPAENQSSEARLRFTGYPPESKAYWDVEFLADKVTHERITRAAAYLGRIHNLHFSSFPTSRERGLWRTLSLLANLRPVTPSLKNLFLSTEGATPDDAYHILPLISSSIKTLTIHRYLACAHGETTSRIILHIFRHLRTRLTNITHHGKTSSWIIHCILEIPTLQSVKILRVGLDDLDQLSSAQTTALPTLNLTKVDLPLSIFTSPCSLGRWLGKLGALSDLTLCGQVHDIVTCLKACDTLTQLHAIGLKITPSSISNNTMAPVISLVNAAPKLHTLCLESDSEEPPLTLSDILVLQDKPLKTLVLDHVLTLTSPNDDLIQVITTWPTLELLRIITDEYSSFGDANVVLSHYCQHATFLLEAALPLRFLTPRDGLLNASALPCSCPIRHLTFPSKMERFHKMSRTAFEIAHYLISLFPRLMIVESMDEYLDDVSGLQEAIEIFQRFLLSPPRRQDNLYQN